MIAPNRLRLGLYCLAIAAAILFLLADAMMIGWYRWMPGSLVRHRDAIAVAITAVAYNHWDNYGAYRIVDRALLSHGLDARRPMAGYMGTMTDGNQMDVALSAASHVPNPSSEGVYYPFEEDEGGMSALFIISFLLFGIGSASWFWLSISLLVGSIAIAIITFHQNRVALILILSAVCAYVAIADIAPRLVQVDVITITSNRNLGLLGMVPALHLMLLMLLKVRPRPVIVIGALLQVGLICLLINARNSVLWLVIAVIGAWSILWLLRVLHSSFPKIKIGFSSWPAICVIAGVLALHIYSQVGESSTSNTNRKGHHVFWHSLATAIHNNPLRTERYGIPAEVPVYDDLVGFILFTREIAARGEPRSQYLRGDDDWIFRTTEPQYDFRWAAYEAVVRDVLLRTIFNDPLYVAHSLVEQIRMVIAVTFTSFAKHLISAWPIVIFLLIGGISIRPPKIDTGVVIILSALIGAAAMPVLFSGVAELRLVEFSGVIMFAISSLMLFAIGSIWPSDSRAKVAAA